MSKNSPVISKSQRNRKPGPFICHHNELIERNSNSLLQQFGRESRETPRLSTNNLQTCLSLAHVEKIIDNEGRPPKKQGKTTTKHEDCGARRSRWLDIIDIFLVKMSYIRGLLVTSDDFSWLRFMAVSQRLPAVESSIAVEDAVVNRGLSRVFVSCLFSKGSRHCSTTIAHLSFLGGLERGG